MLHCEDNSKNTQYICKCVPVVECTVVIKPSTIPNLSLITCTFKTNFYDYSIPPNTTKSRHPCVLKESESNAGEQSSDNHIEEKEVPQRVRILEFIIIHTHTHTHTF
jgi:hypothetical protein